MTKIYHNTTLSSAIQIIQDGEIKSLSFLSYTNPHFGTKSSNKNPDKVYFGTSKDFKVFEEPIVAFGFDSEEIHACKYEEGPEGSNWHKQSKQSLSNLECIFVITGELFDKSKYQEKIELIKKFCYNKNIIYEIYPQSEWFQLS
jgi:hypothetical protein